MIKEFKEFSTDAIFTIADQELLFLYNKPKSISLFTFIWTKKSSVFIEVDGINLHLEQNKIIVLTPNQHLRFIEGEDLIIYQFNREFYCIKDHDKEVSCNGILFYGNSIIPIINLESQDQKKLEFLHQVFLDEMETIDTIQAEMLRMLMARFIITTTRLIKQQGDFKNVYSEQVDLIRAFIVLVESNFRKEHSVSFYAEKLYKSPKTLSNNFSKFKKSPLQIIHDRIILEAKRLLIYTDKSAKEIAYEVGFDDASHLSRMFKKHTSLSPSEFKKKLKSGITEVTNYTTENTPI